MRLLKLNPLRIVALATAAACFLYAAALFAGGRDFSSRRPSFEDEMSFYGDHAARVSRYLRARENRTASALGDFLFLDEAPPKPAKRTFRILMWRSGPFLERRHIKRFTADRFDPFEGCSVDNCKITYEESGLEFADAVVFHLHRLKGLKDMPNPERARPKDQRWVFLTDESPFNTFMFARLNWSVFSGLFNWSMSYKMESDVPVPYGRTVPLEEPARAEDVADLMPFAEDKQRKVLVAACMSNCGSRNRRLRYLRELQQHIDVDVYGKCGTELRNECPGGIAVDCPALRKYHFYLAFENSDCDQYLTEKVFWNSYHNGAVPVIMGSGNASCKAALPPDSFLHVRNYARPADLARHLLYMNETWDRRFFGLHEWRRHFRVENEHGYFGSVSRHYCRLCEALNYNDPSPKVYDDLTSFLSVEANCRRL